MKNLIRIVNDDVVDKLVNIRFNNILEGMNTYKNYIIAPLNEMDTYNREENYINFMKKCFKINKKVNNEASLVVDFYLSKLNDDQYNKLLLMVSDEDKIILEYLYKNKYKSNYYYILGEEILPFFVRLCTRELFFVTFYFKGYEATIWGNYDFKFPIFYKDENILQVYKEVLTQNKLLLL
jgi:hypothetical protein